MKTPTTLSAVAVTLAACTAVTGADATNTSAGRLVLQKDAVVVWDSAAGRSVRVNAPHLSVEDPKDQTKRPLKVALTKHSVSRSEAVLEYALSLSERGFTISGTGTVTMTLPRQTKEDVLLCRTELVLRAPVRANVEAELSFDVPGPSPDQVMVPERDGFLRTTVFPAGGCFMLGQAAKGGTPLGLPVLGFEWKGGQAVQLAAATDPYCGSAIEGKAGRDGTRISVTTTYLGSVIPVRTERRTVALEFHRQGADGTLRSFYRTIPEIEPGPAWIQGIHLVYYDYLSEKGEGWFKDLQALADRIPPHQRGNVAVCLHGWYDYFQQYAYDHEHGKLLKEWTAFPGTHKVPMSLATMHQRLRFAKNLGFRVLLYFADGTNSDSGAPHFRPEYLLKDQAGKTFPGWKGPDSLGDPQMMDPSVPGLRDWYRGYLKALLQEYATDLDGLVWDETFYIPVDFISYGQAGPAYADRAMMSLVAELTQMVQSYHDRYPDLVLLAADNGATSYALAAHGTYQDSGAREKHWGQSMFANYRNSLWSCNWTPLQGDLNNLIAAEKYGLPQGLSNGWEDNCGPSRMPPELLDTVLKRFTKNVESNRPRLRYLVP